MKLRQAWRERLRWASAAVSVLPSRSVIVTESPSVPDSINTVVNRLSSPQASASPAQQSPLASHALSQKHGLSDAPPQRKSQLPGGAVSASTESGADMDPMPAMS